MVKMKSIFFLIPVVTLSLVTMGCGKKHKHEKTDYSSRHMEHKGAKHREEMKSKAQDVKDKAKQKVCEMCGGKTKKGKCVVCVKH